MSSKITFTEIAFAEYLEWHKTDMKTVRKINELLKEIIRNPYEGSGNPEHLKYDLNMYWSRRIDGKNRLVYRVDGDNIEIYQCKGHYSDK